MIVPVPMMTPSTVRNARSLFVRIVWMASPLTECEAGHAAYLTSVLRASIGFNPAARRAG